MGNYGFHWTPCNSKASAGVSATGIGALVITGIVALHARSVMQGIDDIWNGCLISAGTMVGLALVVTAVTCVRRYRRFRKSGERAFALLSVTRPEQLVDQGWGERMVGQADVPVIEGAIYRPACTINEKARVM